LVRKQLQRLLEVGFRTRPLLGALEANAPEVKDCPMRALGAANSIDAFGVDVGAFGKLLAAAQHIAECRDRFNLFRLIRDQTIKECLRLVAPLKRVEPERALDLRAAIE